MERWGGLSRVSDREMPVGTRSEGSQSLSGQGQVPGPWLGRSRGWTEDPRAPRTRHSAAFSQGVAGTSRCYRGGWGLRWPEAPPASSLTRPRPPAHTLPSFTAPLHSADPRPACTPLAGPRQ